MDELIVKGKKDVGKLSERELWLIGTALYWAEGSKQKENNTSTAVIFTNSDPGMLRVYIAWLDFLKISENDFFFEIYVHENRKNEVPQFKKWWAEQLNVPISKLNKVYYKKDKVKTNRTNTKDLYHGLIRITVRSSTALNRRISGWVAGIVNQ